MLVTVLRSLAEYVAAILLQEFLDHDLLLVKISVAFLAALKEKLLLVLGNILQVLDAPVLSNLLEVQIGNSFG